MVDFSVIIGLIFSIIASIGIPIIGFIYFSSKKRKAMRPFFIGMLIFIVFQMLTRIPLLNYVLPNAIWFIKLSNNPYLYGLFLGLTAGIFEEVGRYIAFKYMLKKNNRLVDGISYGFGHGGIEAMLIAGITCINLLVYVIAINNGSFDSLMSSYSSNISNSVLNQCMSLTGITSALIGFERICAMIMHVGFSLIVLYGIRENKIKYLFIAILAHTIVDAPIVVLQNVFKIDVIGIELYVLGCTIVMLIIGVYFAKLLKNKENVNRINI